MLDPTNSGAITNQMEPGKSWELIWKELAHAGIVPGESGPVDQGIAWGHNAERAIQSLQQNGLSFLDIANIGLLIQAAIRATELNSHPGRAGRHVEK